MTLQDQCVSLDLAKQLKELGFKQESLFWWFESNDKKDTLLCFDAKLPNEYSYDFKKSCSAYTVAELGEILPQISCLSWRESIGNESGISNRWICREDNLTEDHCEYATTEADARAKMLIYLKTNNLL